MANQVEILITEEEAKVFNTLIDAYKQYKELPPLPKQFQVGEDNEFARSIQNAQRVIIARAILKVVHEDEEE